MDAVYPPAYLAIIDIVLGEEGGLSMVKTDPGNWTGGAVGLGVLKGTKWGLSAAAFPTLDIPNITRDQAIAIYYPLYFQKAACGGLPQQLALLVMDAAVNNGVGRAVRWLQAAAGALADGLFGTASQRAVDAKLALPLGVDGLSAEFQTQRWLFMTALSTWPTFGLGWARRLCRLPYRAVRLGSLAA